VLNNSITYILIRIPRFPTRNEVENSNAFRMRDLHGKSHKYEAVDSGSITDLNIREKLLANMMAPKVIELKKGAQVMLIKNMDDGLVNGSLGQVVAFMSQSTFDIYEKNPDVFDDRVSTEDLNDRDREARQSAIRKFAREQSGSPLPETSNLFPLVRFSVADGTYRELLVQREDWKVELPNGEVQAQRHQLPLILAWALSIHKAQGQTLERVKIDLKRVFEKGQAYVALSRATSQAGLEVHNFDKSKVMAHPRVTAFYASLYSVNRAMEHPKVALAVPAKRQDRGFVEDKDRVAAMATA
jgi:ATP-dependent DNA helicase PIF1